MAGALGAYFRGGGRDARLFDEYLLNTPLVAINGLTGTRAFAYSARDIAADLSTWPARDGLAETLTKVGSPSLSYPLGGGVATPPDGPVAVHVGAYVGATNGLHMPAAGQDYIIEALLRTPTGSAYSAQQVALGMCSSDFATLFDLEYSGTPNENSPIWGHYFITAGTGSSHVTSATGTYVAHRTYVHVVVSCNRNEASTSGCRMLIDGALSGTGVDFSAQAAVNLTGIDKPLSISGVWDAASVASQQGGLLMVQAWYGPAGADWLAAGAAGQTEVAAAMLARFNRTV